MSIKNLSAEERPREKIISKGANALTSAELIAILLRTGSRGKSSIELGQSLISKFGGLSGLFNATPQELMSVKGMGVAKASQLISAIELTKRYISEKAETKLVVSNPKTVFDMYKSKFIGVDYENFWALYINSRNEIIKEENLGTGTFNTCICHPQEFIRGLVKTGASRLILIHNHPSMDKKPSEQDISFSVELAKSLKYFGFELLDHLIIAGEQFTSLKDSGVF